MNVTITPAALGGAVTPPPSKSQAHRLIICLLYTSVEPVFGILVVLAAGTIQPLMPWLLSFAAGAVM